MQTGAITGYVDVAQLALYAFWLFFAGLIFYLHREDKREGYPLIGNTPNERVEGFPFMPRHPKTFVLPHGHTVQVPRPDPELPLNAVPSAKFPGAPYQPLGNPMLAGMGPGAFALRMDEPDLAFDDGLPKIVPLRAAPAFFLAYEDPNPIGYDVLGLDGLAAGRIVDAWIDRSEVVIRYLEIELAGGGRRLLPMNFVGIDAKDKVIGTSYVTSSQFADIPATKVPEQVTMLEEDKILAYFGGGMLYARTGRTEPLL